jgi:ABC-2 type transport system ATP-binding protein
MHDDNYSYPVIEISKVSKTYPHQSSPALEDISLTVNPGDKIGLLGANGSGKTTLFRLILNFLQPDAGTITLRGQSDLEKLKDKVGFVAEHQEGLGNFTPEEILGYAGRMSGLKETVVEKKRSELLKWTELESHHDELLAGFSKGMRQRLFLASALIHDPAIMLLDEPMSGLDPGSQSEFRRLLRGLKSHTMLYASHQLADVEELCNRIVIFHQGKLIRDLDFTQNENSIFILDTKVTVIPFLERFKEIHLQESRWINQTFQIEILTDQKNFQKFFAECQTKGIPLHRIRSKSILEYEYDKYVKHK